MPSSKVFTKSRDGLHASRCVAGRPGASAGPILASAGRIRVRPACRGGAAIKLGVFEPIFGSLALPEMLDRVVELGLDAVELGCGGYPGDRHCRPAELLADPAARERFRRPSTTRGLDHQRAVVPRQPPAPDAARRRARTRSFADTVRLAAELGVGRVNCFSGCPGDGPGARAPTGSSWPGRPSTPRRWPGSGTTSCCPTGPGRRACAPSRRAAWASRCTPASSSTTRARCCGCARRPGRRSAPTSTLRISSGRASTRSARSRRSGRGRHRPRPRQGHVRGPGRRRARRGPRPRRASPRACAGATPSAASAMATARARWDASRRRCRRRLRPRPLDRARGPRAVGR